jgi:hypothetical protein
MKAVKSVGKNFCSFCTMYSPGLRVVISKVIDWGHKAPTGHWARNGTAAPVINLMVLIGEKPAHLEVRFIFATGAFC